MGISTSQDNRGSIPLWNTEIITANTTAVKNTEYINLSSNHISLDVSNLEIDDKFSIINAGPTYKNVNYLSPAMLLDDTSTAKPTTVNPTIDGVDLKNTYTILFTTLFGEEVGDNNKIFTVNNVDTTPTYTLRDIPTTNDAIKISKGNSYQNNTLKYNGTSWVLYEVGSIKIINGTCIVSNLEYMSLILVKKGESFEFIKLASNKFLGVDNIGVYVGRFQGTNYGYTSGGYFSNCFDLIDKFTFASDNDATDVGDLTYSRNSATGQQY